MEIPTPTHSLYASTGGKSFDPAQPTIAFIHGAGMDHTVWALQTRWFAHHGRNVAALALLGVAPLMPVHPDLLAGAARGEHNAVDLMVTWAVGRQAQIGANEAPGL